MSYARRLRQQTFLIKKLPGFTGGLVCRLYWSAASDPEWCESVGIAFALQAFTAVRN